MAEQFDSSNDYVAARMESARRLLPMRLFAAVFVIAAVAGLARTMTSSSNRSSAIRVAQLTPAPSPGGTAAAIPSTSTTQSTSTTTSAPPTTAAPRTVPPPGPPGPSVSAAPVAATLSGYGCPAALAWLSTHAAPGFTFLCPGYARGHQGMTCVNVAGVCPGERIIAIADPCPAAYMNEAQNSWILTGMASGRLDPYGWCG